MKKIIYFIPLFLIGCKEAPKETPKEYYSAGEVEVIEPVKHTTIVSDSDTVSLSAREYMDKIKAETPLNHMINAEETAPHTVHLKYN